MYNKSKVKIKEWLTCEKDLANIVSKFLIKDGFELYYEVETRNGYCDIIGIKNGEIYSFETKMQYSFEVLEQAYNNKKIAHYSYIVVPHPKKGRFKFKNIVSEKMGVGVILVSNNNVIYQSNSPKNTSIYKPKLKDYQKGNEAGGKERTTDFKFYINNIIEYLKDKDSVSLDEIYENCGNHYSNKSSMKQSLKKYLKLNRIKLLSENIELVNDNYIKLKIKE